MHRLVIANQILYSRFGWRKTDIQDQVP